MRVGELRRVVRSVLLETTVHVQNLIESASTDEDARQVLLDLAHEKSMPSECLDLIEGGPGSDPSYWIRRVSFVMVAPFDFRGTPVLLGTKSRVKPIATREMLHPFVVNLDDILLEYPWARDLIEYTFNEEVSYLSIDDHLYVVHITAGDSERIAEIRRGDPSPWRAGEFTEASFVDVALYYGDTHETLEYPFGTGAAFENPDTELWYCEIGNHGRNLGPLLSIPFVPK